jgi:putative transposase
MARDNRPNIAGAIYHAMNRGNRKQSIFEDERDRHTFRQIRLETLATYGVKLLAETLMDNHFHLGVLTPFGNLSEFMQQLEGQYARYYNERHARVGHLFQGRFRHVLVENDLQLLAALCYIYMNPVAARLVNNLQDYRWSTYAPTAGFRPVPAYLTVDWLESLFPNLTLPEAQLRLRHLMAAARPVAAYLEDCELNVSADAVRQVIRSYTGKQLQLARLPKMYRGSLRPSLDELLVQAKYDRRRFIREARATCGYRYNEIAKTLRVQPATVSRIFRSALQR